MSFFVLENNYFVWYNVLLTIEKTQKCKICWAAKFCNLCFKDIFEISDKFCEKSRTRIEKDLIKYLENIKPNKKFTSYLENLSVE